MRNQDIIHSWNCCLPSWSSPVYSLASFCQLHTLKTLLNLSTSPHFASGVVEQATLGLVSQQEYYWSSMQNFLLQAPSPTICDPHIWPLKTFPSLPLSETQGLMRPDHHSPVQPRVAPLSHQLAFFKLLLLSFCSGQLAFLKFLWWVCLCSPQGLTHGTLSAPGAWPTCSSPRYQVNSYSHWDGNWTIISSKVPWQSG